MLILHFSAVFHQYKNLFFNGLMESKIGLANSHIIIFGWCVDSS
jgi:hypothetical protein